MSALGCKADIIWGASFPLLTHMRHHPASHFCTSEPVSTLSKHPLGRYDAISCAPWVYMRRRQFLAHSEWCGDVAARGTSAAASNAGDRRGKSVDAQNDAPANCGIPRWLERSRLFGRPKRRGRVSLRRRRSRSRSDDRVGTGSHTGSGVRWTALGGAGSEAGNHDNSIRLQCSRGSGGAWRRHEPQPTRRQLDRGLSFQRGT